jgi:hypothetical protein
MSLPIFSWLSSHVAMKSRTLMRDVCLRVAAALTFSERILRSLQIRPVFNAFRHRRTCTTALPMTSNKGHRLSFNNSTIRPCSLRNRNGKSASARAQLYFRRIGSFRALSQNGEWHFGHTLGLSGRFGHQRCSQRLHRTCRMVFSIDRSILLHSPVVNSQLVSG